MPLILFGDDDPEQRRLFEVLLRGAGHDVLLAASPRDVIQQLECNPVDLLIVDLCFPLRSDGLSLIRRIHASGCGVPVIMLSGWPEDVYGTPEEEIVTRLIAKPVRVPELLREIDELTCGAGPRPAAASQAAFSGRTGGADSPAQAGGLPHDLQRSLSAGRAASVAVSAPARSLPSTSP